MWLQYRNFDAYNIKVVLGQANALCSCVFSANLKSVFVPLSLFSSGVTDQRKCDSINLKYEICAHMQSTLFLVLASVYKCTTFWGAVFSLGIVRKQNTVAIKKISLCLNYRIFVSITSIEIDLVDLVHLLSKFLQFYSKRLIFEKPWMIIQGKLRRIFDNRQESTK